MLNRKSPTRRSVTRVVIVLLLLIWMNMTISLLRKAVVDSPIEVGQHDPVSMLSNSNATAGSDEVSWKERVRVNAAGDKIGPPRFLLGIMSYESFKREGSREFDRREMIRATYLRYYKDHGAPDEIHRICALQDIVQKVVDAFDCQIAYAFVVGQSADLPAHNRTELLNASTTSEMIRSHPSEDVVALDIVENAEFGKSPTWFRYATLLQKELNLPFHYVAKTDSDTLLIPVRFLRWIDEQEEKVDYERARIYGGTPMDKVACGWPEHDHCENMTAPYFHGGGFYFVSTDVSQYIVSDQCPRKDIFVPHEDVAMGNYVHSMGAITAKPIIGFNNPSAYHDTWRHPLKDPKRIRTLWRHYLTKKKQRFEARNQEMT